MAVAARVKKTASLRPVPGMAFERGLARSLQICLLAAIAGIADAVLGEVKMHDRADIGFAFNRQAAAALGSLGGV